MASAQGEQRLLFFDPELVSVSVSKERPTTGGRISTYRCGLLARAPASPSEVAAGGGGFRGRYPRIRSRLRSPGRGATVLVRGRAACRLGYRVRPPSQYAACRLLFPCPRPGLIRALRAWICPTNC